MLYKLLTFLLVSCSLFGYSVVQAEERLPVIQTPHATYSGGTGQIFPQSDHVEINPGASIIIVSGQAADNAEGDLFQDTIDEAVEVALSNVEQRLQAAGVGIENVVHITIAVRDAEDWKASVDAYNKFFEDRGIQHRPASSVVQALVNAEYRILFTAQAAVIKDNAS